MINYLFITQSQGHKSNSSCECYALNTSHQSLIIVIDCGPPHSWNKTSSSRLICVLSSMDEKSTNTFYPICVLFVVYESNYYRNNHHYYSSLFVQYGTLNRTNFVIGCCNQNSTYILKYFEKEKKKSTKQNFAHNIQCVYYSEWMNNN